MCMCVCVFRWIPTPRKKNAKFFLEVQLLGSELAFCVTLFSTFILCRLTGELRRASAQDEGASGLRSTKFEGAPRF